MTEIIGNSAIDLLEREDRKGLHDRFRGIALPEAPDDGVESHPRSCHPVYLVVVFDIRSLLHGYRPSQCGHVRIRASAHYTGTSHASHKLAACKVDRNLWRKGECEYFDHSGCKRYWCNGCQRTFNDLTHTLLHQSRRSLPHWILATFLLCLSCSSRRIARELGVHSRTSYRWCWWLRNAALSYEMHRQLDGTVEADDLYHTAGNKGQAKQGGKKPLGRRARGRRKKREPGRGHYDKDRPAIIAWVSRQGAVVLQATKDFTVKTVQKAANLAVQAGSRLYTDSASSYQALKGYLHEFVNQLGR